MDLYGAQRTNFKPTTPRISLQPGQQRQLFPRSANRGKRNLANPMSPNQEEMLKRALQSFSSLGGARNGG